MSQLACSRCPFVGPPEMFPVCRDSKRGRSYWCRACHREYERASFRARQDAKGRPRRVLRQKA